MSTGTGAVRAVGRADYHGAQELRRQSHQRLDRAEGTFETVETLAQESQRNV